MVCSMPATLPFLTVEAAEQKDAASDRAHIATIPEIPCARTT